MPKKQEIHAAVGRRKSSTARAYLYPVKDGEATFEVNRRAYDQYFSENGARLLAESPLTLTERADKYRVHVRVAGGGFSGQAGAVRHALSRALIKAEPELRGELKKAGFLTRDAREVERKKPGRHKARKKPQFSKR